jgi:hypothetical protein
MANSASNSVSITKLNLSITLDTNSYYGDPLSTDIRDTSFYTNKICSINVFALITFNSSTSYNFYITIAGFKTPKYSNETLVAMAANGFHGYFTIQNSIKIKVYSSANLYVIINHTYPI